jgi:hypothetical protein
VKPSNRPPVREADIQRTILDYLALRRIFHYRQNTGATKTEKRFFRFGAKGAPDIIAVHGGIYHGIEVKKPGEVPTDDQAAFGKALIAAGGEYIVAHSVEDVMKWL